MFSFQVTLQDESVDSFMCLVDSFTLSSLIGLTPGEAMVSHCPVQVLFGTKTNGQYGHRFGSKTSPQFTHTLFQEVRASSDVARRKDGQRRLAAVEEQLRRLDLLLEVEMFSGGRADPVIRSIKTFMQALDA